MTSTAFDTYLYLLNGSTVLASDDDGNGGTNSKITYTPTASGTLTIHATSYSAAAVGAYTVSLTGGTTTAPAAPSGLSASASSSSQINLSWADNSSNETGFKIERKTGSGGTYAQIATVGAGVTTYSNTGLTASTTYYYRVRSTNSAGDSAYSNEANATTQTGGTELLTNGGFDTGSASPWVLATYSSVVTTSPQAGSYCAKMMGNGTTSSSNFYQTVAGFNGTTKTLRFYLKMSSGEGTTTAYDFLYVRLKNTTGGTVSTLATYSNVNKNSYTGWTLVTLTVPSTALANYRISFDATEDVSIATTFYIDSVSVQ
jgi:hypothetical protein